MDLSALRVLDLTQLLPGPYATQLLRDLGAEVIKVERPGGEPGRRFGEGETPAGSALFDVVNRGKRSVTVDLKTDAGREAVLAVAEGVDVVVEQFRPGVVDRLGVGYEDVRARNGDVVYCSMSGYGATGPYRDRAGHDLNYVGTAGLLDMTRPDEGSKPVVPGYPIADMAGGLVAALSIVSALLSRELGDDGGEHIDVAMTDAVLSLSQIVAGPAVAGVDQRPGETVVTGKYPCYGVYECAEGRYVTLAALEPAFWEAFCGTVGRPDLADEHMADDGTTRERVREELRSIFAGRSREEWLEALADVDATVGPVNTVREAFADTAVGAREFVREVDGQLRRAGFPAQGSDGPPRTDAPAPLAGEHTEAVLRESGYGADEVAALESEGVVSTSGDAGG
jgi:crotonobetainyl-CoA:carnitine CoA-transferase CaiB-like acyl-CoA transferase